MSIAKLQNEITEDIGKEISYSSCVSYTLIEIKVKNAIREVKNRRSYPSHFTEEAIARDLETLYSNIRDLALYDYNQIGAEGQISHSENGESRNWKDREECLKGVFAWAGF